MRSLFINSIFLLLLSTVCFAQAEDENDINYHNSPMYLFPKSKIITDVTTVKSNTSNIQNSIEKGVLIQQIGHYDYVNANLKAKNISMSIIQKGNDNKANIDKSANIINQKILQEGNRNEILDYTYLTNYNVNMDIEQRGNNQSIKNFGTNSLSKSMKIIQSGNGASVIILNSKKL